MNYILLFKLYLEEIIKRLGKSLAGLLFISFYFGFLIKESLNGEDILMTIILSFVLFLFWFTFILNIVKSLNKNLLIKHYKEKILEGKENIREIQKTFDLNKEFVKESLDDKKEYMNQKDNLQNIIVFIKENQDILFNSKLIDRYKIEKKNIKDNMNNLEQLFLSFKKYKRKKAVLEEYKMLKSEKKQIDNDLNDFKKEIDNYLKGINNLLNSIIEENKKKIKDSKDISEKSFYELNIKMLNYIKEKHKKSI